jgi:hypothetical protein
MDSIYNYTISDKYATCNVLSLGGERPSQTKEQIFGNHEIPRSKIIDGEHGGT